jgi:dimethylhistidine N-methyltransferase
VPADVSPDPLEELRLRLAVEEPRIDARPLVATHDEALAHAPRFEQRLLVLFIGSSIGNYDEDEAVALLRQIRGAIAGGGAMLLGTDLRKSLDVLLPAYDDAAGVTARFNKNVLTRINRELGGEFDLDRWKHVALWNERASRIEMHLESTVAQSVRIDAVGESVSFARGERIHTESSHKYDDARVTALLGRAGLRRAATFRDANDWFAVHLATTA